ncbi:MAG TPA: hypothetical protein VEZ42_20525 [Pseudonocardia sp.]|jgi:hypothetical protein|nr:hypothetical protein [Pseudonocardia sp.]
MTELIIIALLVAMALVAPRYGADSHTSDGWTADRCGERPLPRARHTPRADLAALRAAVTGRRRAA